MRGSGPRALFSAVAILLLAGCSTGDSDEEPGSGAAASALVSSVAPQASAALSAVNAQLCSTLTELGTSLETASQQGVVAGDELSTALTSIATTLHTLGAGLEAAGASDAGRSGEKLADDVDELANGGGEDARARAADAADAVADLSSDASCPGS